METTKNTQLGVYLHRAKEKEHDEPRTSSVDERIGQVELLMRRNQRRHRQRPNHHAHYHNYFHQQDQADTDNETDTSSGDLDAPPVPQSNEASRSSAISSLLRADPVHKSRKTLFACLHSPIADTTSLPLPTVTILHRYSNFFLLLLLRVRRTRQPLQVVTGNFV